MKRNCGDSISTFTPNFILMTFFKFENPTIMLSTATPSARLIPLQKYGLNQQFMPDYEQM